MEMIYRIAVMLSIFLLSFGGGYMWVSDSTKEGKFFSVFLFLLAIAIATTWIIMVYKWRKANALFLKDYISHIPLPDKSDAKGLKDAVKGCRNEAECINKSLAYWNRKSERVAVTKKNHNGLSRSTDDTSNVTSTIPFAFSRELMNDLTVDNYLNNGGFTYNIPMMDHQGAPIAPGIITSDAITSPPIFTIGGIIER